MVREKLIEILDARVCEGFCDDKECNECIADHLLANGVTVQKWIPITERLPKEITNKVLVYCKCGYIGFGHYEEFQGTKDWFNLESGKPFTEWDLNDCKTYAVTHWMALPEPPKVVEIDQFNEEDA